MGQAVPDENHVDPKILAEAACYHLRHDTPLHINTNNNMVDTTDNGGLKASEETNLI